MHGACKCNVGYSGDCCEHTENTKKGKVHTEICITAVCVVINHVFLIRLESYFRDGLAKENSSIESNLS